MATPVGVVIKDFITRFSKRTHWQLVSPLLSVFSYYRFKPYNRKDYRRFVKGFENILETLEPLSVVRAMKYIKYHCNRLLLMVSRDRRIFENPFGDLPNLFRGFLGTKVARCIRKGDSEFILSLQKAKALWDNASPDVVLSKFEEIRTLWCRDIKGGSQGLTTSMKMTIQSTSRRVLGKFDQNRLTKFQPQRRSCLQASRAKLGAQATLTASYPIDFKINGQSPFGHRRQLFQSFAKFKQLMFWEQCQLYLHDIADPWTRRETLKVKVVPLLEPGGKVRTITINCGVLRNTLQPIQGEMIRLWKRMPQSTMSTNDADLTHHVSQSFLNAPLPKFKSVDYSSATDTLFRAATLACFAPFLNKSWGRYAFTSFLPHLALFPKSGPFAFDLDDLMCLQGQMMGHSLSFVCLCMINLSVLTLAVERWMAHDQNQLPIADKIRIGRTVIRTAIVNGDDIVFNCDDLLSAIFDEVAVETGFILNPAKCLVSEHCLLINSQYFYVGTFVRRVHYFNQKLLFQRSDEETYFEWAGSMRKFLLGNRVGYRALIRSAQLKFGKDAKIISKQFNWHAPIWMGGGNIPTKHQIKWNAWQLRNAGLAISSHRIAFCYSRGYSAPQWPNKAKSQWMLLPKYGPHLEGINVVRKSYDCTLRAAVEFSRNKGIEFSDPIRFMKRVTRIPGYWRLPVPNASVVESYFGYEWQEVGIDAPSPVPVTMPRFEEELFNTVVEQLAQYPGGL